LKVSHPGGSFKTSPSDSATAGGRVGGNSAGLVLNKPPGQRDAEAQAPHYVPLLSLYGQQRHVAGLRLPKAQGIPLQALTVSERGPRCWPPLEMPRTAPLNVQR
jgi:hypothetical protein